MDSALSCHVCNKTVKEMRGGSTEESVIQNHILACPSHGGKRPYNKKLVDPSTSRTTRSGSRGSRDKEKRRKICLPVEQPLRISFENTQPPPIPPSIKSYKKTPPRNTDALPMKCAPKASSPKRTKDIISSPRTVAIGKRPQHNINLNETSQKNSPSKKKRRNSSAEQQQRKTPDIKHHNLNSNETSKKVSSSKKMRRTNSVEQQQRKALDIKYHNLNSNVVPPDDAIEVSRRKDSLQFLRGGLARSGPVSKSISFSRQLYRIISYRNRNLEDEMMIRLQAASDNDHKACSGEGIEQEPYPLTIITPKLSGVFSSTSSDCKDDCRYSYCEPERGKAPTAGPFHAKTTKPKKTYFWKTRIAELLVIQIILFASITLYVQNTNQLSLSSATIVAVTVVSEPLISTMENTAANSLAHDRGTDHETGTEDCIYVPGGGFSGFWFSLGRLQSLEHPHNETFVCYSAGCLGVVATLLHHGDLLKNVKTTNTSSTSNNNKTSHYNHVYDIAQSLQLEWQSGKRHRYIVVEGFIDGLLKSLEEDPDDESRTLFLDTIRSKLNIVTTSFKEETNDDNKNNPQLLWPQSILPTAYVRRPSDISSLKRLLLQSSWIPLATGSLWTHKGHMDGGFSRVQHPVCSRTLSLTTKASTVTTKTSKTATETPSSWYESLRNQVILWVHFLNMKISQENVEELWRTGMEHGV